MVFAIGVGLATAILTVACAGWIASTIDGGVTPQLVTLSLSRLPFTVYAALATTALSGAGMIGSAAGVAVLSTAAGFLAPLGALVADDPLSGAVLGSLLGSAASAAITATVTARWMGIAWRARYAAWRDALRIAFPMHLGTLAYWVMLRGDAIVVGILLGASSAGTYGLALALSERVGMLTQPLYNATAWRISGPNRTLALDTTLAMTRAELILGLLAGLAAALAGPLVIQLIAGPRFAAAAAPLFLLVVGAALLPVWSALGLYLVSHGSGAWLTAGIQVAISALAIVGYWAVTPSVGIAGTAAVSTSAYLLLVLCGVVAIRRADSFPLSRLVPSRSDIVSMKDTLHGLGRRAK